VECIQGFTEDGERDKGFESQDQTRPFKRRKTLHLSNCTEKTDAGFDLVWNATREAVVDQGKAELQGD
jgi:hypothetical protein